MASLGDAIFFKQLAGVWRLGSNPGSNIACDVGAGSDRSGAGTNGSSEGGHPLPVAPMVAAPSAVLVAVLETGAPHVAG